jgi:mono/diheme cytochrome c family protein
MRTVTLTAIFALTLAGAGAAQDAPNAGRGAANFELKCAPCHGAGAGDDGRAMLPGTDALRIKYQGAIPAVLEQRTDLGASALSVFLRQGTMSMPPFRKTELSDQDIADIAAYLAETSSGARQPAHGR